MDILHRHGVALYCYASFALQIHRVEQLVLHFALLDCACCLQQAVGQGRFAVVNVRYYAEIPYIFDIFHFALCI